MKCGLWQFICIDGWKNGQENVFNSYIVKIRIAVAVRDGFFVAGGEKNFDLYSAPPSVVNGLKICVACHVIDWAKCPLGRC